MIIFSDQIKCIPRIQILIVLQFLFIGFQIRQLILSK